MADLKGRKPFSVFGGLLNVEPEGVGLSGLTSQRKQVQDGRGNLSPLELSTEEVNVPNGKLLLGGVATLRFEQADRDKLDGLPIPPLDIGEVTGLQAALDGLQSQITANDADIAALGVRMDAQEQAVSLGSTLTTDINASATDNLVGWDVQNFIDGDFTHSTSTNNSRLAVSADGRYHFFGVVTHGSAGTDYSTLLKLRLNGSTDIPTRWRCGYISDTEDDDFTSLPFSVALDLTASDYVEILIDRDGSETGVANLIANQSVFCARRAS